jgi:hypothetical protein
MAICDITPISAFMSTNLNNKITCFGQVADRIKSELGWPLVSVEIHQNGLNTNIQKAVELYTKFAGYTEEYVIFDSQIYERDKGIRMDNLFSVYSAGLTPSQKAAGRSMGQDVGAYISTNPTVYVSMSSVPSSLFASSSSLSANLPNGIDCFQILDCELYTSVVTYAPSLSAVFNASAPTKIGMQCRDLSDGNGDACETGACGTTFNNMFDYDVMDYRKVIAVPGFEEGSSNGVNQLFTLEQSMAQSYNSFALGNHGFDMVTWYTMKEWLDLREKMFATKRTLKFDDRTQYLVMYPQPTESSRFYGLLKCYVERPIRDILKEPWVQQYALALTKIVVGRVRGKFQGVSLLGGGSFNYDLLQEGREEKAQLEKELKEGATPGWDTEPTCFFMG